MQEESSCQETVTKTSRQEPSSQGLLLRSYVFLGPSELADRAILLIATLQQLIEPDLFHLRQIFQKSGLTVFSGQAWIMVRAAQRLRDYLIHQSKLLKVASADPHSLGSLLGE